MALKILWQKSTNLLEFKDNYYTNTRAQPGLIRKIRKLARLIEFKD